MFRAITGRRATRVSLAMMVGLAGLASYTGIRAGDPPAGARKILSDDFSGQPRAVPVFGEKGMSLQHVQGAARLTAKMRGNLPAMYAEPRVKDFVAEFSFRADAGQGGYGLVFRSDDHKGGLANYGLLMVHPHKNRVFLQQWDAPKWAYLKSWNLKPGTVAATGEVRVRLEAIGPRIRVAVNGQEVCDERVPGLDRHGIFGLCIDAPGDAVEFRKLLIYEPLPINDAPEPTVMPKVVVPDISGMTAKAAQESLHQKGLTGKFQLGQATPTKATALTVAKSSPPAGMQVAKGSEVTVTLFGPAEESAASPVAVPTLAGLSAAKAKQALEDAGLKGTFQLGKPAPAKDKSLTAYLSEPAADARIAKGTEIKVTLYAPYDGKTTDPPSAQKVPVAPATNAAQVKVPSVDGMTAAQAKQVIEQAGLKASFELGKTAPNKERSLLAFQSTPPAGTLAAKNSEVKVTLYAEAKGGVPVAGTGTTPKGTVPGQDKKALVYRFDHIEVHRGYDNLRPAWGAKALAPTKDETFKTRLDKFETGVSTNWYTHRVVLTIDAPETVTQGQEVTLTATSVNTFDIRAKDDNPPHVYVRIGLPAADVQTTPQKAPLPPGSYTVKASKSVTVRFDPTEKYVLTFSQANGVRYAKFGVDARSSLTCTTPLNVYWYYRADPIAPSPTPTPSQPARVDIAVRGGTIGVPPVTGVPFTLSATVHNPRPGQTARVELPPGLELAPGSQHVQPVPAPAAGGHTSVVTWQVRPAQPGNYQVKIDTGNGAVTPQVVAIAPAPTTPTTNTPATKTPATTTPAPRLELSAPNKFSVGRPFAVSARLINPAPNQDLTLLLTPKLERLEGAERQIVPPGSQGTVDWKVRATEAGQFTLRVSSGTGLDEERSITITPARQNFTLLDAQRALKMWVGLLDEEADYDLDGNGFVDSNDAIRIIDLATARPERRP